MGPLPIEMLRMIKMMTRSQARRQLGGRGCNAPRFSFLPPRFFFLAPPLYFFGRKNLVFLGGKTSKFAILARKSLRISAKTFFFFEITCFWSDQKKPSHFGENLCPPDFNFASPDLAKLATSLHEVYCLFSFL